jgi:PAS domain S-box-containing protein
MKNINYNWKMGLKKEGVLVLSSDFFLEKDYFLDAKEENYFKSIDIFELAQTTQLPVIENYRVIGIVDIFSLTRNFHGGKKVSQIMEKKFLVARKEDNIYSYNKLQQKILPFVDEQGSYIGFVKIDMIEKQLLKKKYYRKIQYYKELQQEYKAIFESSYDGITVTDGQGITLRINPAGERIEGVTSKDVEGKPLQELVQQGIYSESATLRALEKKETVTILQKVPSGKEIIVTGTPIFKDDEIIRVITNSRDITELNDLKRELTEAHQLAEKYQSELKHLRLKQIKMKDIVIHSPKMKKILTLANHIASVDSTVLIEGESGVGKGVLNKFIYNNSKRKNGPFIKIDCGSIPETLLESELFGYEKGAFTGARKEGKIGLIELANGGTLFLDEIGEVPLNLQVKLLRVLQDREIVRIGGKNSISVDIRIIAATNRNLATMVKERTFREDLYYRLNVVPIYY